MKARIAAKGIAPDRIDIVRDGIDTRSSSTTTTDFDPEVIRTIRADFRFVLVHGVAVVKNGELVEGVSPGRAARAPIAP